MADGMHKMRLAQADAAVQKQRVICLRRLFSDGLRRRVRESIAIAHDEFVEQVARIKIA